MGLPQSNVLPKPSQRGQGLWGRLSPLCASVSPPASGSGAAGDMGTSQHGCGAGASMPGCATQGCHPLAATGVPSTGDPDPVGDCEATRVQGLRAGPPEPLAGGAWGASLVVVADELISLHSVSGGLAPWPGGFWGVGPGVAERGDTGVAPRLASGRVPQWWDAVPSPRSVRGCPCPRPTVPTGHLLVP